MLWADLLFCLQLLSNSNKKMFGFCVRILFFWSKLSLLSPFTFSNIQLNSFFPFYFRCICSNCLTKFTIKLKQKNANAARKSTMVGRLWSMANKRNALHFLQLCLLQVLEVAALRTETKSGKSYRVIFIQG